MKLPAFEKGLLFLLILGFLCPLSSKAYSVFAHEAIIDASWKKSIVPLLKEKFPHVTENELRIAHSYAYGGALMPDMGYFPFGSVYFTNLVHYVRSGDFVNNLLAESQNINEYAFALGALSHYLTDKYGHSLATNIAVPIVYPKMGKKYGAVVTYEDDHTSHTRMEFGFDVLQTARGNYASQNYHDFIGFNVARPVLERAFLKTYGQDLNDVFGDLSLSISTFRWSVKNLLPGVTRTAWVLRKAEIKKTNPTATSKSFHYKIKKREYYQEFGKQHEKLKFKDRVIAFILATIPKIGPLKALRFKDPGPVGEKLFIKSFDTVLVFYAQDLKKLGHEKVVFRDIDYDTGMETRFGEYGLADQTYSEWLLRLQDKKFNNVTAPLKKNILAFYSKADSTQVTVKNPYDWKKTNLALQQIKAVKPIPMDSLKFSADTGNVLKTR